MELNEKQTFEWSLLRLWSVDLKDWTTLHDQGSMDLPPSLPSPKQARNYTIRLEECTGAQVVLWDQVCTAFLTKATKLRCKTKTTPIEFLLSSFLGLFLNVLQTRKEIWLFVTPEINVIQTRPTNQVKLTKGVVFALASVQTPLIFYFLPTGKAIDEFRSGCQTGTELPRTSLSALWSHVKNLRSAHLGTRQVTDISNSPSQA